MEALKGNKTYIVAALAGVVMAANVLGYIDDETKNTILGFLGALGGATMAAKINRTNKITEHKMNALLAHEYSPNPLAIPTKETVHTPGFSSAGTSQSVRRDPYKKG